MRLYWNVGEDNKPDPGLMPLASVDVDQAVAEADVFWFKRADSLTPPPLGYLIYDRASRKIVHERNVKVAAPAARGVTAPAPAPSGWLRFARRRH